MINDVKAIPVSMVKSTHIDIKKNFLDKVNNKGTRAMPMKIANNKDTEKPAQPLCGNHH